MREQYVTPLSLVSLPIALSGYVSPALSLCFNITSLFTSSDPGMVSMLLELSSTMRGHLGSLNYFLQVSVRFDMMLTTFQKSTPLTAATLSLSVMTPVTPQDT